MGDASVVGTTQVLPGPVVGEGHNGFADLADGISFPHDGSNRSQFPRTEKQESGTERCVRICQKWTQDL